MTEAELQKIKSNIFPAAWPAIGDPLQFDWHPSRKGIDTWQTNSSQALCLDVFGTLSQAPEKDKILGGLARRLGLCGDGPWEIRLEWIDHGNPLNEPRPTQVDAAAIGGKAIILFECKFTEPFGSCFQIKKLGKGAHKGQIQCNGKYEPQTNPVNNKRASCALTGKGIRYWDYIPELFSLDPHQVHTPCPFMGKWYQLMRNLTLAAALREQTHKETAVAVIYTDHPKSSTAKWLRLDDGEAFKGHLKEAVLPFLSWTYLHDLLPLIQNADSQNGLWRELASWVADKQARVFD